MCNKKKLCKGMVPMAEIFDKLGELLEKVIKYNLFEQVNLEDIGDSLYKHKNFVFDKNRQYTPEIYIFADDSLDIVKNRKNFYNNDLCLHVYGLIDVSEEFAEAPNYASYWHIRGKWNDYLENYAKDINRIVSQKEKETKESERISKQQADELKNKQNEERIKKFEQFI
jgi:hypothetical protein